MSDQNAISFRIRRLLRKPGRRRLTLAAAALVLAGVGVLAALKITARPDAPYEMSSQSRRPQVRYLPTQAEWASLTVESVTERVFRAERATEGKIAIDEDRATPVFSPYTGRVTRLLARPGDEVAQGQPLFVIEATDNVQAQNDFITAVAGLDKSRSQLAYARLQDKRAQDLFAGKAIPLKDVQTAQAGLVTAQNDVRSSETAFETARSRLRLLGLSDEAIATFQDKGRIDPETTVPSPIGGTVVQRKIGPGQFVSTGSVDPVFVIGDTSKVWLTAFVREKDASGVAPGQDIAYGVLAYPGQTFKARIDYVAASLDPVTRRLMVRATIDNRDGRLKPEMFANVTIYSGDEQPMVSVPKQALVYESDKVSIWVALPDKSIELRRIKTGAANGDLVAVSGLAAGEQIITKGSLFTDRPSGS